LGLRADLGRRGDLLGLIGRAGLRRERKQDI
jgi:hypothetical protein